MKTFKEFIIESNQCIINSILFLCEGDYSDEDAFRKIWNHFITHKKYGSELRQLLRAKDFNGAKKYMESEVESARNNPNHPLSFEKAKRGFKGGKTSGDIDSYFNMMKLAPDSVTAFVKGRRGSNTSDRVGVYARVSGGAKPPTSSEWEKETGKSSDTSKRDIEFVDPKNRKYGLGLSLKMGKGSQTISAEPDEAYATFQAAGKEYIKKLRKRGASREEIDAFQSQLNKTSQQVRKSLGFTSPQMTPKVNKELSDRRLSLAQRSIDKLFDNHPKFISDFDKEGAEGRVKFGKGVSSLPDNESPQVRAAKDALQVRRGEIEISGFKANKNDDTDDTEHKKLVRGLYKNPKKIIAALKSSPSGSAQEVVTGTNIDSKGNIISGAKSVPVSQRGRTTPETGPAASAPKGMTKDPNVSRPANVKLRVSGSQEPVSRQSSFAAFSQQASQQQIPPPPQPTQPVVPKGIKLQHIGNFIRNQAAQQAHQTRLQQAQAQAATQQPQPQTTQPQPTQQQTPPPDQQNQRKKRIQPQQPVLATPITQ
ncbi:MAG: hypothetical protein EBU90_15905 [Proteobacteria bacterium]|nr:hypothetical protein [Pseudomonadota bacterium]